MNRKDFLYMAVIFWLSMFLFKECRKSSNIHSIYSEHQDSVKSYISKNNELIFYNNTIETDLRNLKKYNDSLLDEISDMRIKKPSVIVKNKEVFILDTLTYVMKDTLPCDDFFYSLNIDSSDYKISILVTKDSISINKIEIPNNQTIVVGYKKDGFFKKKELVVAIKNSNKLIKSEEIKPIVIKDKNKNLNNLVYFSAGAASVFVISVLTK